VKVEATMNPSNVPSTVAERHDHSAPCYPGFTMTAPSTPAPRKRRIRRPVLLALVALLLVLAAPAHRHLRAASLLLRFADASASGLVAEYGTHPLDELDITFPSEKGEVRARLYTPRGVADAPGVVIVHGVHRLGIEEPRLMRFSRAVAASGVAVLTPQIAEIADYHIDAASIETIGSAARALRARLGGRKVGVMGMSFAGGLALLAAADRRFAGDFGAVVAIGAHHDLGRVLRFFATNEVELPGGERGALSAHPYGAQVLLYSHMDLIVPAADAPAARDAMRLWLWEQPEAARARAKDMSESARTRVEELFEGKGDLAGLVARIPRDAASVAAVSPAGHLSTLEAPVFLLHGAADNVIPASETAWLAAEVPPSLLRSVVVTPAVKHVEIQGEPTYEQQWELVRFMAETLKAL
jgi:pimeloyl-ACP methyl ester carboxylesterase